MITEKAIEEAIGPIVDKAKQCHSASVMLMESGLFPPCRVARGWCKGVTSQHSWLVLGDLVDDCYSDLTPIVDITLWSYDSTKPKLWLGTLRDGLHKPHWGESDIWEFGCPESGGEREIELTPSRKLSGSARLWLDMFRRKAGWLDRRFWARLMSDAPYHGWPSAEFTRACYDTKELRQLIPIDRVGMQTDLNPGGLYILPSTAEVR